MICKRCDGSGVIQDAELDDAEFECDRCEGTGEASEEGRT